jgi:predicted porin
MKKNLIALAVLAASGVASAQSSVTLYGAADVWFGGVKSKVGGTSTTQTVINSDGVDDSFFGLKGTEDLGGGLKANFVLEQGYQIDSGASTVGGQAFSRQSYVGFSSAYGEARLGKTFTPFDDISGVTTPGFDSALAPTAQGVWRSTGYNANPANTAYYATPTYSGFSGAVSYSFGEDKNVLGNNKPSRVSSFNVKYANGPVYAGLAYQAEKTAGTGFTEKFLRLNGSYDFGVAKLLAGYGRVEDVANVNGNTTTEWQIGADVPVSSALTLSAGYARSKDDVALGNTKRTGVGIVAHYALSKRTALYGGLHASKNNATPAAKTNVYAVGVRHTF